MSHLPGAPRLLPVIPPVLVGVSGGFLVLRAPENLFWAPLPPLVIPLILLGALLLSLRQTYVAPNCKFPVVLGSGLQFWGFMLSRYSSHGSWWCWDPLLSWSLLISLQCCTWIICLLGLFHSCAGPFVLSSLLLLVQCGLVELWGLVLRVPVFWVGEDSIRGPWGGCWIIIVLPDPWMDSAQPQVHRGYLQCAQESHSPRTSKDDVVHTREVTAALSSPL